MPVSHRAATHGGLALTTLATLSLIGCGGGPAKPTIDLKAPEATVTAPAAVVRHSDLNLVIDAMEPADRKELEDGWKKFQQENISQQAAEANAALMMIKDDSGIETIMGMVGPSLAAMDPEQMASGLDGLSTMFSAEDPNGAAALGVISDAKAWITSAGLNDEAKLREVLGIVKEFAKAQSLNTVQDLQKLSFAEAVEVGNAGIATVKKALAAYGVNTDAVMDSIKVNVSGEGPMRDISVNVTFFGNPRSFSYSLPVKEDGTLDKDMLGQMAGGMLGNMMMGGMSSGMDDGSMDMNMDAEQVEMETGSDGGP